MKPKSFVSDLLDLSVLQTGTYRLDLGPVEVRALIEGCLASVREQASMRGLPVEGGVGKGLPRLIQADERRLASLLSVLTLTVVRQARKGPVAVLASRSRGPGCQPGEETYAGCWLDIRIADTGEPVPANPFVRRLRGPFSCGGGPRRRLALMTAARWCEVMDGGLWLEGEEPGRMAFIVRLPLGEPAAPLVSAEGDFYPVMPSGV